MLNEVSSEGVEDVSVDILELSRSRELAMEAKDDPDATEYSSSFAETISGLSDVEVESQFIGDADLDPPFDGFGSIFPIRKKKLTDHWRNFIRPLMWRCKWTELRMKELESQASKYAKELAAHDHWKHMALDQTTVEQCGSKSLPYRHQSHRKRPLMRRRRKRVEDTTDIASYVTQHILFSERENKRHDLDGVPTWENHGSSDQHMTGHDEFGINDDCAFPDDDDNFFECILRKIELVHTRVHKLKAQLDTIMIKNAAKFSSSENLSQLVADVQSPTFSACNGDTVSVGDFIGDIGDFIMPESAVSSFGEAVAIPDIIESTVGLLSIDVTHHQAIVGDSSEKIVDNILIQNDAAEVEGCGEESNKAVILALEPDTVPNPTQPILKPCLSPEIQFPTNKRKRGERKAGSGNWARKRPAEPDS